MLGGEVQMRKTAQVEIHDHFNGAAHCVECRGKCQLPPAELLATGLIRDMCEQWEAGYSQPWMMVEMRLKDAGVNLAAFMERAKATNSRHGVETQRDALERDLRPAR